MRRPTWLDQMVYSFQHRWEMNPQFRAMASGLVGLVLILIMCSCMGVLNATANSALAAIGLGGTTSANVQGTPNTGTNQANGYQPIPTPSVVYPTSVPQPVSTVPQSQTPPPYPTATSTATPTDTPTSGGGGGGGGGSCNGGGGGTSWTIVTCPPHAGRVVTLSISAPGHGNQQMGLEIKWGGTSSDAGCFWIFQPTTLDSSGSWSNSQTVPSDCTGPVTGNYSINGGGFIVITGPNMV